MLSLQNLGVHPAALERAVEWQMIPHNIADSVKAPRPKRHYLHVWTIDETQRLIEATAEIQSPYGACIALALPTGMRQAALIGLRWSGIDLERGQLRVVEIIQCIAMRGIVASNSKTASSQQQIALPPLAVEILTRHKVKQNAERLRAGPSYADGDLVFANPLGQYVNAGTVRGIFHQGVKPPGCLISPFTTCATPVSCSPVTFTRRSLSERLGHSNIGATLNIYSRLLPGLQDAAADKLDDMLRKQPANSGKMDG